MKTCIQKCKEKKLENMNKKDPNIATAEMRRRYEILTASSDYFDKQGKALGRKTLALLILTTDDLILEYREKGLIYEYNARFCSVSEEEYNALLANSDQARRIVARLETGLAVMREYLRKKSNIRDWETRDICGNLVEVHTTKFCKKAHDTKLW